MLTVKEDERTTQSSFEDKRKDAEEMALMLRDMSDSEVNTVKGIMIGIRLSRESH